MNTQLSNRLLRVSVVSVILGFSTVAMSVQAASANNYATTRNFASSANILSQNTGRLSGSGSSSTGGQVPAQATTQEAVRAASLPSNAVLNFADDYQDVESNDQIFGEQLFRGAFSGIGGSNFNSSYVINSGDNVQVRMWGAYQYAATMTVDPQGNIFLPNVGPVRIAGVSNGNLQRVVKSAIGRIYRSNVGVYASLEQAQPIKVFVTGFVNQPGYYGGVSADTVLSYLDRAGGVDPNRGSYIDIDIIRNGKLMQQVDLYEFLWNGNLRPFSFRDGDVIRVSPQKKTFRVSGKVQNAYRYEFNLPNMTVGDVLRIAHPQANATNVSITRSAGREQTAEYYAINEAVNVPIYNGDEMVVTSDRYAGTIAVSVQGAHTGNGAVVMPYGARLKDIVPQLQPSPLANMEHLTIYRASVAEQQKRMINEGLDRLEEMTLATQSTTKEEAALRQDDAKLIQQFIAKARQVKPTGQIVVVEDSWQDIILQQGDVIEIPEQTSVISVNGNVRAQGALTFNPDLTVADYIAKSGGFDDNADTEEILIIHQNGEHEVVNGVYRIQQGDKVMVLPKVKTKRVEIARGLSQILYQLAVATGVILKL